MDSASTIEQRIVAMKIFRDAGIRATCFISPIFPGITDVVAIIEKIKNQCDYIWLENLNLRGEYKPVIMNYIESHYPDLVPLYKDIYQNKSKLFWEQLDKQIATYAEQNGCLSQNLSFKLWIL